MTQGRAIRAEIDVPDIVEIPQRRKTVEIAVRISLFNEGESVFVAHARNRDDTTFWHVFDEHQQEVQRERGAGKGGVSAVKVSRGVHSYRSVSVGAGTGVHGARKLILDASKLEAGHTYTVRGEFYGHRTEVTFVAVPEAAAAKKRKRPARKKSAKKTVAAKAKAKAKAKVKAKAKAAKRPARKAKKRVMRSRKKK